MNKTEFLRAVADKAGLTLKDAGRAYDAMYDVVRETLANGEKIQLVGYGTYELKCKPARECINPATKTKVKVPACKVPCFKFGKAFKELF